VRRRDQRLWRDSSGVAGAARHDAGDAQKCSGSRLTDTRSRQIAVAWLAQHAHSNGLGRCGATASHTLTKGFGREFSRVFRRDTESYATAAQVCGPDIAFDVCGIPCESSW
jgi:hypothetical protein